MAQQVGGQVVGNIGMYYAAHRLSQHGWNVMPTSRNAREVNLLAYDVSAHIFKGIQVKASSQDATTSVSALRSINLWVIGG